MISFPPRIGTGSPTQPLASTGGGPLGCPRRDELAAPREGDRRPAGAAGCPSSTRQRSSRAAEQPSSAMATKDNTVGAPRVAASSLSVAGPARLVREKKIEIRVASTIGQDMGRARVDTLRLAEAIMAGMSNGRGGAAGGGMGGGRRHLGADLRGAPALQ